MDDRSPSAQDAVLATPELVDLLSLFLTPTDLYHCIQVNRCWSQVFAPILWHTVDDKNLITTNQSASNAERNEIMDEIRTIFKKYGHHIRVLCAQWDIVIEAASFSCIHLKSLHLRPSQTCRINEPETWAAYPGASEAAKEATDREAMAEAKEKARRSAAIEAFCADRITAATTPEEVRRLSILFSDKECRTAAVNTQEFWSSFPFFLKSFTIDTPENQAIREIKQLPGDLGVLIVRYPHLVYSPPNAERLELDWLLLQDCWRLVAANPALQKLRMEHTPAFQEREASRKFVHSVLATLKDLRDLSLPASFMDSVDFWRMDEFAPMVETLELHSDCIRWMSNSDPQQQGKTHWPEITVRGLRTLCLDFLGPGDDEDECSGQVELANFSLFLERLPDLESLSLKVESHQENITAASLKQRPLTQLQHQASGLRKLYFQAAKSQLSSLLPFLPNLTELHSDETTVEAVAALVTHCKKIEVVSHIRDSVIHGTSRT